MSNLEIPVELPDSLSDINFGAMAEHFSRPIHIFTDLEGTSMTWDIQPPHGTVGLGVLSAISDAANEGAVIGTHAITNRPRAMGGRILTKSFVSTINNAVPSVTSFAEYPRTIAERKPSGLMSKKIVKKIGLNGLRANAVVAFVGDKLTDMLEAQELSVSSGIDVVGFMVKRYGKTDLPFVEGMARKTITDRDNLRNISQDVFTH